MRQERQKKDLFCTGAPLNIGGSFSSLSNEEKGPVHSYSTHHHKESRQKDDYIKMLHAFQEGEEKAFDHYFKIHYKALCFFANRHLNDLAASQDIATEAFIELCASRERIETEAHLKNYLYAATHHSCLDYLQKNKTKQKYLNTLKDDAQENENEYIRNIIAAETTRQVEQAISLLPPQCKRIFHKLYLEGKTVGETAAELGLAISTVNNQKSRGIKILRSRLTVFLFSLLWISYNLFV